MEVVGDRRMMKSSSFMENNFHLLQRTRLLHPVCEGKIPHVTASCCCQNPYYFLLIVEYLAYIILSSTYFSMFLWFCTLLCITIAAVSLQSYNLLSLNNALINFDAIKFQIFSQIDFISMFTLVWSQQKLNCVV